MSPLGASLRRVVACLPVIVHAGVGGAEEELQLEERGREHANGDEDEECQDWLADPPPELTVLV